MRPYPQNSPQAAARIVALTLVSDGQLKKVELHALEGLRAQELLGLSRDGLRGVLDTFCADLIDDAAKLGTADCQIDADLIGALFGEVDTPALRATVLRLCKAVVHADHRLHEGEAIVLMAAMDHWGAEPEVLMVSGRRESGWTS